MNTQAPQTSITTHHPTWAELHLAGNEMTSVNDANYNSQKAFGFNEDGVLLRSNPYATNDGVVSRSNTFNVKREKEKRQRQSLNHRVIDSLSQSASTLRMAIDPRLNGVKFGDDIVKINGDNQIRYGQDENGEWAQNIVKVQNENGEWVNATADQVHQLEENSKSCSMGTSQETIDVQEYMNGKTNDVPEMLQKMAEERGIENPTRADHFDSLKEKYGNEGHMTFNAMTAGYNPNVGIIEPKPAGSKFTPTEEQIDFKNYLNGETDSVPEALKQVTEERNIQNPTREDYRDIVKEVYGETSPEYGYITNENSAPAQNVAVKAEFSSNAEATKGPNAISTPVEAKNAFESAASGQPTIATPQQDFTPAPAVPLAGNGLG